jgi:hypothetical protein
MTIPTFIIAIKVINKVKLSLNVRFLEGTKMKIRKVSAMIRIILNRFKLVSSSSVLTGAFLPSRLFENDGWIEGIKRNAFSIKFITLL